MKCPRKRWQAAPLSIAVGPRPGLARIYFITERVSDARCTVGAPALAKALRYASDRSLALQRGERHLFRVMSLLLPFIRRHAWSLSLTAGACLAFLHLASEMRGAGLGNFDALMARSVVCWRGQLDAPMLSLSKAGGLSGMATVCALGVLALLLVGRNRDALFLLSCGLAALLSCAALKAIFHRVRPAPSELYVLSEPASFSFPSGHALGSMSITAALVVLVHVRRLPAGWRAVALAAGVSFVVGVGASRVYFGVHYPSDILGGQLAGGAIIAALTGWFYPGLLPGEAAQGTLAVPRPH